MDIAELTNSDRAPKGCYDASHIVVYSLYPILCAIPLHLSLCYSFALCPYTSQAFMLRSPALTLFRERTTGMERKRGDCLSEASYSPFSEMKEESRKRGTALIFSFGIFSFASRQKKSTSHRYHALHLPQRQHPSVEGVAGMVPFAPIVEHQSSVVHTHRDVRTLLLENTN